MPGRGNDSASGQFSQPEPTHYSSYESKSHAPTQSDSDLRTPAYSEPSRKQIMNTTKNILSSDVEIKGSLKFSNDLVIDGKIEGEVTSDGSLTIGENAHVKGELKTKSVTVFGKVEGNITVTDRCELKKDAELIGDVRANTLAIEEGATFMGKSIVGAAAAQAAGSSSPASRPTGNPSPLGSSSTGSSSAPEKQAAGAR